MTPTRLQHMVATCLLLLLSAGSLRAQTIFSSDFSSVAQFETYTVADQNQDGQTWTYDDLFQAMKCTRDADANDWLITPAISFDAAKTYKLTFTASIDQEGSEQLAVALGNSATPQAMARIVMPRTGISNTSTQTFTATFTTGATGSLHLGFHLGTTGDPFSNTIYLYSITVEETMNQGVPASVTGLTVTPGQQGALQATVAFRTPDKAVSGSTLQSLTRISVLRDGKTINTLTNPGIGQDVSFEDTGMTTGMHTYKVVPANDLGEGVAAETKAYVGVDVPGPVTNLRFTYDEAAHKSSVSWEAPTTGANGGYVSTEGLTYSIRRIRQADANAVKLNQTHYEDEVSIDYLLGVEDSIRQVYESYGLPTNVQFVIDGQGLMQYYVRAISAQGQQGPETVSGYQIMGQSNTLPYYESFAGGERTHYWRTDISNGRGRWAATADSRYTQDGDGGMLAFSTAEGNETAMAHTGNISLAGAQSPVLSFYYYVADPMAQPLTICVSTDGGDFQPVATLPLNDESLARQYRRATVSLAQFAGQERVQVGFQVTATTTVDLVYLDNISIIDQHANDLTVAIAALPRALKVGDTRYLTATVRNLGTADVAAGQYTISAVVSGIQAGSSTGQSLPSGQQASILVPVSATIDMQPWAEVYAEVVFAADEVTANNRSATDSISVKLPRHPAATNLQAATADAGVTLSWSQPAAPRSEDEYVTDSFEQYPDFTRQNFGDWTLYDGDRRLVYGNDNYEFPGNNSDIMSFMVFNPYEATNVNTGAKDMGQQANWQPRTGQKAALSFGAYMNESDDWLISPELPGKPQTVSFWARHTEGVAERFSVYFSTTGTESTNFTSLDAQPVTTTAEWKQYEYVLPQGSRYFAIRKVTNDGWAFFVDDVTFLPDTLAAQDITLYGYRVYRCPADADATQPQNWQRVQNALVSTTTFTDAAGHAGDRYRVTAVYDAGESVYSNTATAGEADGIEVVSTARTKTNGQVYNLNGQRLRTDGTRIAAPRKGIVIKNGKKITF